MTQPNFNIKADTAALPGTDFDSMSDEQLNALINQSHQLKTGRLGRVSTAPPPPQKRHVDLDYIIKQFEAQK